jgi:hypothetical protein
MGIIAEDNMNVQLKDITVTARDGRVSHLDQVYIRGSHVRFFIVPDMLRLVIAPSILLQDSFLPNCFFSASIKVKMLTYYAITEMLRCSEVEA